MRIAFVHYHLKRGGVTRVIENTLKALTGTNAKICVITGDRADCQLDCDIVELPELRYTQPDEKPSVENVSHAMKLGAQTVLGGPVDLWHIHNHSLGKNFAMPDIVHELASSAHLLLHIHDFAEDGRPTNYAHQLKHLSSLGRLYPMSDSVHYGVLNGRDYGLLQGAGIPQSHLHALPNPVSVSSLQAQDPGIDLPDDKRFVLYPTRAIRRKNMGELLYWAATTPDTLFASTLSPANPTARPVYEAWLSFAAEHKLPVKLGIGDDPSVSFEGLMNRADALITTSVAEGFGLAFLEPWLFGKTLAGRNLPAITQDFTAEGINLDDLYPTLQIPIDWIGADALRAELDQAVKTSLNAYQREVTEEHLYATFNDFVKSGLVDFGRLSEPLQRKAITHVIANPQSAQSCTPSTLKVSTDETLISANAEQIRDTYSLENYGNRLYSLYQDILKTTISTPSEGPAQAVLDGFLSPEQFNLLRT